MIEVLSDYLSAKYNVEFSFLRLYTALSLWMKIIETGYCQAAEQGGSLVGFPIFLYLLYQSHRRTGSILFPSDTFVSDQALFLFCFSWLSDYFKVFF